MRISDWSSDVCSSDLAKEADVIAMFDATLQAFGPLDGLVNNAGVVAPTADLADMSLERLKTVFDTNILGSVLCAREAARRMSTRRGGQYEGRGGAIVNLRSEEHTSELQSLMRISYA